MNISQPIASSLRSVNFGFLAPQEIRGLSVKRIQNPETFDSLLNPVPGGLYDRALGANQEYLCTTCNLGPFACPGHPGHIDLPLPVYHPMVLDQVVHLLNGKCAYCHFLRMSETEVNLYTCKFRLLRYGLIEAARGLDQVTAKNVEDGGSSDDVELDESAEDLIAARNRFVKRAIKDAGFRRKVGGSPVVKTETVLNERRETKRALLADMKKGGTKCKRCNGRSQKFRRDKFDKLFRKPLGPNDAKEMKALGRKAENPLLAALHAKRQARKEKQADREADEGIDLVADDMQEEEEEVAMLENELADSGLLDTAAQAPVVRSSDAEMSKIDQYVNPEEVRAHLDRLFEHEEEVLEHMYSDNFATNTSADITPEMFFIRTLLVPANRFRPDSKTPGMGITEAEQNNLYRAIMNSCGTLYRLQSSLQGKAEASHTPKTPQDFNDFQKAWIGLQNSVNALLDSNLNTARKTGPQGPEEGIKQKFEKKEGLFRMNMMGKRVNFAARSVISPDPNIETNEIGVPPVFAKKLTFAEPVTNHNFYELKEAVMNGPNTWPGATAVESETGQIISLMSKSAEERQALANQLLAPSSTRSTGAKNKKVHRHLNNGDIVIMNRQPTLHKPSMMCHRARILPGEKTIRMHYANCNTYNADFDGDEMNMHFPQSEIGRAEALTIADTDHQYLGATEGKPLRGLIQDHLSMGVCLTNRDTMFSRGEYQQLLYSALRPEHNHTSTDRILTVDPAIIKPKPMWTGKQIITTILLNLKPENLPGLTLKSKTSTEAKFWGENSEEGQFMLQGGELLCGILDKANLGPSTGGLVHATYEAYGHTVAGKLLSILGRLLTRLLSMRAWSCGMEDIELSKSGDNTRRNILKEASEIGIEVAANYVSLSDVSGPGDARLHERLEDVLRDEAKQVGLDNLYNNRNKELSSLVTEKCLPNGLFKPFPHNHMQTMTSSGAKGSMVNANQISCNLGQQILEGRRVPVMVSGKTLPSFKPFETHIKAGGYITNRFLSGVQPQEYYFHAMAGREGLIDTAVKTSRSGYLQRCVIKGMEGLKVEYDTSVRDSDGTIVQFLYGEDGLDVTKQKFLREFKFLAENFMSVFAQLDVQDGFNKLFDETASDWNKKALKRVRKGDLTSIDPVMAHYNPGSTWGSTSEGFAGALKDYIDSNPDRLIKDKNDPATQDCQSKKGFQTLMDMKYMKAVVDPGEAVGIVAGQSIGEPSTQMTLNTFHLAGHAAKNVTLGIPRLKEIVMTASKVMSTPTMTLYLNDEITPEEGQQFAKGLSRLSLAEIIDTVTVKEKVENAGNAKIATQERSYDVVLNFFPKAEYEQTYAITSSDVAGTLSESFVPNLAAAIKKDFKDKLKAMKVSEDSSNPQVGVSVGRAENGDVGNSEPNENADGAEGPEAAEAAEADREDAESVDEDDAAEDSTQAKKKRDQEADAYEDADEEEEEALVREGGVDAEDDNSSADEGYGGSPKPSSRKSKGEAGKDDGTNSLASARAQLAKLRSHEMEARLKANNPALSSFEFDDSNGATCKLSFKFDAQTDRLIMLPLVEKACRSSLIHFIPGIKACTYTSENVKDAATNTLTKVPVVLTEGTNLLAMRDHQDVIDPHRLLTNDIATMLTYYGVEAARATIVREIDAVFAGHGIRVDGRHLNLIADMMTRAGGFKGFNRGAMSAAPSPFMKMSFETTVAFLKDAVLARETDDLRNPSARLVTGKTSGVGTGAFDVLVPLRGGTAGDVLERDEDGAMETSEA